MMKFASFETIVEKIYKHVIPKPNEQCSKPRQLAVSFAGGFVAGVLCAVVSHPADNLVSFLNNAKGATVSDVSLALLNFCSYEALICYTTFFCLLGPSTPWFVGPFNPWSSASNCYDWNSDRSSMGNI